VRARARARARIDKKDDLYFTILVNSVAKLDFFN